ncbi:MAG: hypothetical protein HN507_10280 [Flavobacteriaceae bacterium]|jgi:hypothetical protein|nr:hypothetical protein [Flavobacteriaceae bacterium]
MKNINQTTIWAFLMFICLIVFACSDDMSNSDPSSGLGTEGYTCSPPDSLIFDLALWHEGYSTGKKTDFDMSKYLETLMAFIKENKFKTVFITVPSVTNGYDTITKRDSLPTINQLKLFVNTLASDSIGIGIQFGLNNAGSAPFNNNPDWFDYSEVLEVVGTNEYILGLDSENYHLNINETIKVVNVMTLIDSVIKPKINAAGGDITKIKNIAVAGGMKYNHTSSDWGPPFLNVFEYYSTEVAGINKVLSKPSNVNNPQTAFNNLIPILTHYSPTDSLGGISSNTVEGWPAFSFEQTDKSCLAGCFGEATHNTCGSFNILGHWEYNCILQFMNIFKEHYYQPSDRPTFVLYQSDYLPHDWLPNGCP